MPVAAPRETSESSETGAGWRAELALRLAPRGGRTVIDELRQRGPLRVLRAFHPQADGTCHVYLLHPPGGLVGGDAIAVDVTVAPGGRALVTTPAAGKLYRSDRRWATQTLRCRVGAGAALEWLPQENIAYAGSWARLATRVELAPGASFMGWEITALGRPAAGERFDRGALVQRFELWRDGAPLWLERGEHVGGDAALDEAWGLGGATAIGVLVAAAERAASLDVEPLRAAMAAAAPGTRHGVTALDDVIVARCLGASAEAVRAALAPVWAALRLALLGSPAVAPRIWAT